MLRSVFMQIAAITRSSSRSQALTSLSLVAVGTGGLSVRWGVKTNRSQQHPEREGPISVIGATELHIHDRGTKRDWRKYAGRRGEDPMAAAGGEGNARRRRAAGTRRGRPQPAVDSREGSGASGGGAQQQKGGEPAGGARTSGGEAPPQAAAQKKGRSAQRT